MSYISLTALVCILPFPALLKISERPIRTAVCGVYSLAVITIIISILRAVLLGLNTDASLEHISILTMIEVMTVVVVGCLPGLSSTFTRKYVYHVTSKPASGSAAGQRRSKSSYRNFVELRESNGSCKRDSVELLPCENQADIMTTSRDGLGRETSGERL